MDQGFHARHLPRRLSTIDLAETSEDDRILKVAERRVAAAAEGYGPAIGWIGSKRRGDTRGLCRVTAFLRLARDDLTIVGEMEWQGYIVSQLLE